MRRRSALVTIAVVGAVGLALTGCGSSNKSGTAGDTGAGTTAPAATTEASAPAATDSGSGAGGATDASGAVGLLLPENQTARYEAADKPMFEAKLKALCPNCTLSYQNAQQDATTQQQQAQSMITAGVKVLVLDPVDAKSAESIVTAAAAKNIPVVSYDRFIGGGKISYYISFDNQKVGELQGEALVQKLGGKGKILMVNGSPTDSNAAQFKAGAHKAIDAAKDIKVVGEYDTIEWKPENAQQWVAGQLAKDKDIQGIYCANDGTAGGAIAAAKAAGLSPVPPVTGQDAELAGIQRIVSGDQYMTVYKAIKPEAEKAAEVAVQLMQGQQVAGDTQYENIPSTLLTPVSVTKDTIKDTVVKDGFYTVAQICTSQYATACKAAGLE